MQEPKIRNILNREMTRKEFLGFSIFAVATAFGVTGLVKTLLSHAATSTASSEIEGGSKTSGATIVADSAASNGSAVQFKSSPTGNASNYGPISYASLDALLIAGLGPDNARTSNATLANGAPVYVIWPAAFPNRKLHEQFATMQDGQILVLPERGAPYEIDSSQGFCASGVSKLVDTSLPAGQQDIPIVSSRGWFTMARARRGIIGLGPGAVVRPTNSGWTRPRQGNSTQLGYIYTATGQLSMITGCQEKLIETGSTQPGGVPYFGNFTLQGRDFGGVAYSSIASRSGTVFERMKFHGAARGFSFAPNGESGCISIADYVVRNVELDGRDPDTGQVVGTSVFMANKASGGTVDHLYVHDFTGGPAIWASHGTHTWNNYVGPGFNLEASSAPIGGVSTQFYFNINDGEIVSTGRQFNVRSPHMSQKITLRGTKIATSSVVANIWSSGSEPRLQKKADILGFSPSGASLPITAPGAL